ncbi:MAG TPA: hypothetical protein EYQ50_11690 [Verrucomicrobiales bacterium]|nr:hypothetical protein [Verrucomicrobiales bacterium]
MSWDKIADIVFVFLHFLRAFFLDENRAEFPPITTELSDQSISETIEAPFFPIGIYGVGRDAAALPLLKEAGFNTVFGNADTLFLDRASELGLQVLSYPGTSIGSNFDKAIARKTILKYDAHPALFAWYLIDEPDMLLIAPNEVRKGERFIKQLGAIKPTTLVLFHGYEALNYAHLTDILMIDRYPVPLMPLADFAKHLRMTRLALGKEKPMISVIQAFDWSIHEQVSKQEKNLRPPNYREMRCMTFCSLAYGVSGLFYYTFNSSKWNLREHPEVWNGLKKLVREINDYLPLFTGERDWSYIPTHYKNYDTRLNKALEPSILTASIQVVHESRNVPEGRYLLCINTTPVIQEFSLILPEQKGRLIPMLMSDTVHYLRDSRIQSFLKPYDIQIFGPMPPKDR